MEHSTCFIGTLPGAWTSHKAAIPMGEVRGTIGYMGERFCLAVNAATRFWLTFYGSILVKLVTQASFKALSPRSTTISKPQPEPDSQIF